MTEAQKAALRSFYAFHSAKTFADLADAEARIRQLKAAYADIWSSELQRHWTTALKMVGRRRNHAAAVEAREGTEAAPKAAPLVNAQSFKVTTDAVPLNVRVAMRVVERRFVGSDHVVIEEACLLLDGVEVVLPSEVLSSPAIARALKLVSHAGYAKSLQSEPHKVAPIRARAA